MELRYFIVYKPYRMISQFVSPYEHRLLGDLNFEFPEGTHAVGRLDDLSEGLLILTTDKTLTARLLHPDRQHIRKYLVLVEKTISEETIQELCTGVEILIKQRGKYITQPCEVRVVVNPDIHERDPELIQYEPHSWLEFVLKEGKNRQIRKMCKAVHHECKRLLRTAIEDLTIDGMSPGEVKEISRDDLVRLLHL